MESRPIAGLGRIRGVLVLALLPGAGGCATDYGIRSGPTLEEVGAGFAAFGAMLGVGAGVDALQRAGGDPGNRVDELFRPEWSRGDP